MVPYRQTLKVTFDQYMQTSPQKFSCFDSNGFTYTGQTVLVLSPFSCLTWRKFYTSIKEVQIKKNNKSISEKILITNVGFGSSMFYTNVVFSSFVHYKLFIFYSVSL